MVENGHSAELNHVSSTSGSCVSLPEPHFVHFDGVSRATIISAQSPQCQAGIRCPHQSCREIHQSRMLYIHSKYVLLQFSGTNWMRPSSTTRIAGSARGFVFTNHCFEISGSTTVLLRWHLPTLRRCGSTLT